MFYLTFPSSHIFLQIAFSCLLAVASASYWGVPAAYHAQHVPIIGPGGVPLEPPANVAARAAHAAAVVAAGGHAGPLLAHGLAPAHHGGVPADTPEVAAAKAQHAAAHAAARGHGAVVAAPWAYAHHGIASHGVLPAETPEVAAARAAHLAAHAAAAHGGHVAVHVPVHDDGSYHGEHNHLYGEDDGQYHGEW